MARDPGAWFVRRAGLARFTTMACAAGLTTVAFTGPRPAVALAGLTAAVTGAIAGTAHSHAKVPRGCSGRRGRPVSAFLVISVVLIGLFGGYLGGGLRVAGLNAGALQSRIGASMEARLVICGPVRSNAGWQSATATIAGLRPAGAGGTLEDADDPAVGEKVLFEMPPADESSAARPLAQGLIIACRATLQAPEGPSDSGYDQARQLLHQGIEIVVRAERGSPVTILGSRGGMSGWFDRLRAAARSHLDLGPDARVDEVLQGVVMGDTMGIDEDWMNAFRRSGTAHMLSVSGLHVASIAAIMIGLAGLLGAARWVGFLLAACSSLLLIPFVGSSPPVVRSAVMIVVVLIGRWVGRGRDQWQILALAAVVVLSLNPYAVFDVGFQLSFSAFVGMLVLAAPLQRAFGRLPAAIGGNMAVSVAAGLGTAPVSLAVFGRMSLISPVANLLVVPLLPLVTGFGMAAVFLGFVWHGLAAAFAVLASLPMMWTILASRLCSIVPVLESADLGRAFFAVIGCVATLPLALASCGRIVRVPFGLPLPFFRRSIAWMRRRRPRSRSRSVALAVALALAALVLGGALYPAAVRGVESMASVAPGRGWPDKPEVRVLDVGQGNAVLVRTPGHRALLFDGGPAGCDLAGQLHRLGVRTVDLVVISHPHADHFAGLLEALDGLQVRALIDDVQVVPESEATEPATGRRQTGGNPAEAADYLALRADLADDGCRYVTAATGHTASVDGVTIRCYAPAEPLVLVDGPDPWTSRGEAPTGDELNASSLVARVSIGGVDILIPGDAEAGILQRFSLPATEAVLVPHHGSRGALSPAVLSGLKPSVVLISVGRGNSFGHPDPTTLVLLEQATRTVLRTDTAGWVSCTVDEDKMVITSERTPAR